MKRKREKMKEKQKKRKEKEKKGKEKWENQWFKEGEWGRKSKERGGNKSKTVELYTPLKYLAASIQNNVALRF